MYKPFIFLHKMYRSRELFWKWFFAGHNPPVDGGKCLPPRIHAYDYEWMNSRSFRVESNCVLGIRHVNLPRQHIIILFRFLVDGNSLPVTRSPRNLSNQCHQSSAAQISFDYRNVSNFFYSRRSSEKWLMTLARSNSIQVAF